MLRVLILLATIAHTAVIGNLIYLYIPSATAPNAVATVGWIAVSIFCLAWLAPFLPWITDRALLVRQLRP